MTAARGDPASDTIVAIATPAGPAAIGVIRVSGPRAVASVSRIIRLGNGVPLEAAPVRVVHRGTVVDPGTQAELDVALVVRMEAQRSYTGQDMVELSCHGNPVLLGEVVKRIVASGARLADPGEFTRRAYLNGRLDLVQVEAVAELIGARTERALYLAARQLRGALSGELGELRERLLDLIAGLEVALDFPDDQIGTSRRDARTRGRELVDRLDRLIAGARQGRTVHDGLSAMIAGAPNVGKSSLLNMILGTDRAIVSPVPGTTRDLVESALVIRGVVIRVTDGAGLGRPRDDIDAEGMRRARLALEQSDLVLVVLDGSREFSAEDGEVLAMTAKSERLIVLNKSDLPRAWRGDDVRIDQVCSAATGAGVAQLLEQLSEWVGRQVAADGDEGGIIASLRVLDKLAGARAALDHAVDGLEQVPVEAVLVDLQEALAALHAALGLEADEAVLDRIFETFCVGK